MKKTLITIAIILILILTGLTIIKGLNLGNLSIFGIKQIREENDNLEEKIKQATSLVNISYPQKLQSLDNDLKEMKNEKQKYEDMVATTNESEIQTVMQEQVYTIDKLWEKLGMLARYEGLNATFEPTQGTRTPIKRNNEEPDYKYYDIKFTLQGGYANIALYIADIENNSQLGFRIDNFKMVPDGENVKATFTCKDIAIKGVSNSQIATEEDKNKEGQPNGQPSGQPNEQPNEQTSGQPNEQTNGQVPTQTPTTPTEMNRPTETMPQ